MTVLKPRVAYELKRAAHDPTRHLARDSSPASRKALLDAGLAIAHNHGCPCLWYVLTPAGVDLARTEYGIMPGRVSA